MKAKGYNVRCMDNLGVGTAWSDPGLLLFCPYRSNSPPNGKWREAPSFHGGRCPGFPCYCRRHGVVV
jgi:hypothetical protein